MSEYIIEEHFRQLMADGVTVIRNSFPGSLIADLRNEVSDFMRRNDSLFGRHRDAEGHFPRIINMHLALPDLLNGFCRNEVALGVQDRFFGSPSSVYTTLYYERGSAQPIHRDTPYFCTRPEQRYLGVWVALEDADATNGCLEVIRKGHLIPEVDRESMARDAYGTPDAVPPTSQLLWDRYQQAIAAQCAERGLTVEQVCVSAGDCIIWHPQLPHGGGKIHDFNRTRHSLVLHVTPVGVPVYHQDVFFNPSKEVPSNARWEYLEFGGRLYANHPFVEFGHTDPQPPSAFVSRRAALPQ